MPPMGAPALTVGSPECITVPAAAGCPPSSPGMMAAPGAPGPGPLGMPQTGFDSGMPPMTPPPGGPGMPPTMAPGTMPPNMPPPTSMPPGAPGSMPPGSMPPMGDHSHMPPMGSMPPGAPGMPPTGDSCMTVPAGPDRDACYSSMSGSSMPPPMAPNMGNPNMQPPTGDHSHMPPGAPGSMPPGSMPPGSMPPTGDHSGMSSLGAHCGAIQAKNEKKRMRKEVKCLRRALHEHKPTVKLRQTKDGLGAYGCGVKKTGSKPAQIACLRGLLDAPGGPGMSPGDHSGMQGEHHDGARGLIGNKGPRRGGKLGRYGCGNKNKRKHVNCLRDLLDTTPLSDQVKHAKKGKKRGFYGCGNKNKKKHTRCLRRLLDQHGPHLAIGGGKRGMAPGTR